MTQSEKLRQYNRWRRGEDDWSPDERGPDPKELGELIDGAADRLEVLEREHKEFFERWHDERRRRESLQCAVENLVAQKGRHNTEIAYKRLVDVLTHNAECNRPVEVARSAAGTGPVDRRVVRLESEGGES